MNTNKLKLIWKIVGVSLAITGLLCCILKLCGRFSNLCLEIVEDEDNDLGYYTI
ncbi:MAG: hypothetical protein LUC87_03640 [Clostridiales bacterium]|nr:hypothetical protein [Clostridiales bacterium]MCD8367618.1 hypothetical protein [Clostridiales bacterium]